MDTLNLYLIEFKLEDEHEFFMTFRADDVDHAIQQAWEAEPSIPIVAAYFCDLFVDRLEAIEEIIDKVRAQ